MVRILIAWIETNLFDLTSNVFSAKANLSAQKAGIATDSVSEITTHAPSVQVESKFHFSNKRRYDMIFNYLFILYRR